MVTYKAHTSSKVIYTMSFKHTSMEDGPTLTQIQLLLPFVVVCVIRCVGEETILYTCLERGVVATERKDKVGGGNSYRFSLTLSPSQSIFVYESGNQMFLLSAKPNIGRAFEQCRLTVFLRLSIVIV